MPMSAGRVFVAALVSSVFMAISAHGATVTTLCPGTAATNDREFSVTTVAPGATCIASGVGNISGNPGGANPDPLFAILGSGYQLIDKSDVSGSAMSVSGVGGLSGMWSFLLPPAPKGSMWSNLVIAFKSGVAQLNPDWVAFGLSACVTSGTWSINNGSQSLSHVNLYGQLVPAAVPLPAAGVLMVGALGALAASRRKRRQA